MIDEDHLNLLIDQKKTFMLGARGIAVKFYYNELAHLWWIEIARASCLIQADFIGACSGSNYFVMEIHRFNELIIRLDLSQYTKITVIE